MGIVARHDRRGDTLRRSSESLKGNGMVVSSISVCSLLALLCVAAGTSASAADTFEVTEQPGTLVFSLNGQEIAAYMYADAEVLRPFLANVRTRSGTPVTRPHPPRQGIDADDHADMHPGMWLAFGDISGEDYWRNRGSIVHERFLKPPLAGPGVLRFATRSGLLTAEGARLATMDTSLRLRARPHGWAVDWTAVFSCDSEEIVFGDQEEMGFAARMATPLTETNGGRITSSSGLSSAADTWGQPAAWCDTSGRVDGRAVGITLIPDPANFRESWWHNRAYGVFVANPFGRAAMQQGSPSRVVVAAGKPLTLRFTAVIHEGEAYAIADEVEAIGPLEATATDE